MSTYPPPRGYTFFHFSTLGKVPIMGRNYGCLSFLGDCFMTLITGGLWLIWIFVREMRRKRYYPYY